MSTPSLQVGLDATPLLGQPTGVGRYVAGLIGGFAALVEPPDLVLARFSIRGAARLPAPRPVGTRWAPRRFPARLLQTVWGHSRIPPVEWLTGSVDVFHATNFVLPPRSHAGGVVTVHDLAFLRFPETVSRQSLAYRTLVPASIAAAEAVIAVSNAVGEEIEAEYGVDPSRIVVAPNGVDERWFRAVPAGPADLRRLGLPSRYLLFVGSLEPRKNLRTLLSAHAAARAEDSEVPQLVLAGPAGWGDRWAGAPGPGDDVVLAGYLPQEDLERVAAGAVAVCMPSIYEGFGLPVLEAFATGRKVIASDIAAHREVAGPWATYVDSHDVGGWSQALLGSQLPDELSAAEGRKAWARSFTWTRCAEHHLSAYARARG